MCVSHSVYELATTLGLLVAFCWCFWALVNARD